MNLQILITSNLFVAKDCNCKFIKFTTWDISEFTLISKEDGLILYIYIRIYPRSKNIEIAFLTVLWNLIRCQIEIFI